MTQSMWDWGINGWLAIALISGADFLLFLVLLLAAAALGRHVFLAPRRVRVGMPRSSPASIEIARALAMARAAILGALLMTAIASAGLAAGPERFILHDTPKDVPPLAFADGSGRQRTLAEFHGKVVLINIWATWCGPCRREMPALDRLQTTLGGPDFEVLALSIDRTGADAVKKFYAETGVRNLGLYIDTSGSAARLLNAVGLPVTLLIDREGRERGRLIGPAEWDTPEMIEFLKRIVAERTGHLTPSTRSHVLTSITDHVNLVQITETHLELATQHERRRSHE